MLHPRHRRSRAALPQPFRLSAEGVARRAAPWRVWCRRLSGDRGPRSDRSIVDTLRVRVGHPNSSSAAAAVHEWSRAPSGSPVIGS
jgi:hypothetical protein